LKILLADTQGSRSGNPGLKAVVPSGHRRKILKLKPPREGFKLARKKFQLPNPEFDFP
jgi:hypothetical protein